MVSFPFWLFSLTDRQSLGLTLPLILHSAKGGCKALRFCCSSRMSAGWVRPHEPTDLAEPQKKVQFAKHRLALDWHSHTHSALLPLSLAHTHTFSPTTRKCQLLPNSTDDLPILIELPDGETNAVEWERLRSYCTNTVWFYGFISDTPVDISKLPIAFHIEMKWKSIHLYNYFIHTLISFLTTCMWLGM